MNNGVWLRIASVSQFSNFKPRPNASDIEAVEIEITVRGSEWSGNMRWWQKPPLFENDAERLRSWDGHGRIDMSQLEPPASMHFKSTGSIVCGVRIEDGPNRLRLDLPTELAAVDRFAFELAGLCKQFDGEAYLWAGRS